MTRPEELQTSSFRPGAGNGCAAMDVFGDVFQVLDSQKSSCNLM